MSEPKVRVFFYGSYMNPAVLREVGIVPERFEVARLDGYDIRIAPRPNLMPSTKHCAYGVLVEATHAELVCVCIRTPQTFSVRLTFLTRSLRKSNQEVG